MDSVSILLCVGLDKTDNEFKLEYFFCEKHFSKVHVSFWLCDCNFFLLFIHMKNLLICYN